MNVFRGSLIKEGQHFQRFMLALQRLNPGVFEQLHDEVFKHWLEARDDLEPIMQMDWIEANDLMDEWFMAYWDRRLVDPETARELGVTPKIFQYILTTELWIFRCGLDGAFTNNFVIGTMMKWEKEPELRERRELSLRLTPPPVPKQPVGKKPTPPEITEFTEDRYRKRVETYIQEVKAWRGRKYLRPRRMAKYACKSNPLHYEWAVLYQCLKKSPGDICKLYNETAPLEESEMLSYIKRTLNDCLFTPRYGKAGKVRNNDAILQNL